MDFGSASPTQITVKSRLEALSVQERAAVITSAAYRAPELFAVKSNCTLTEAVDVWSLGCTLYAMAYALSPFEIATIKGGSLEMAALNAVIFPSVPSTSAAFQNLVQYILVIDPTARPSLDEVISRVVQESQQVVIGVTGQSSSKNNDPSRL
mmetsp:Transcript_30671/g.49636  ORF Transcript_30671/g.49636 Transcript_30671/m.49636 type:complete len:152 (+) Transcript_30671:27-482(+)